jgi:signal transduction histidine kinase
LLSLINDLLDFSRVEAGKLELQVEEFQPGELIAGVLKTAAIHAGEKGLALGGHIDRQVPEWVEGDAGRFRQIVVNLVGNAVKFTHRGEVQVSLGAEPLGGRDVRLHFAVRDTGIGIPPEKQQEIFEAFTQVDASSTRRHGGAGLGLAITAELVKLMGGEVAVHSEVDRGSTFTVAVPVKAVAGQFLVPPPPEPVS